MLSLHVFCSVNYQRVFSPSASQKAFKCYMQKPIWFTFFDYLGSRYQQPCENGKKHLVLLLDLTGKIQEEPKLPRQIGGTNLIIVPQEAKKKTLHGSVCFWMTCERTISFFLNPLFEHFRKARLCFESQNKRNKWNSAI